MSHVDFTNLVDSPLFTELTRPEIEILKTFFTSAEIPRGKTIFVENMPGESLYLLQAGKVEISQMLAEMDEQVVVTLEAGDIFGEVAVIDKGNRIATARTLEDSTLYSLSHDSFNQLLKEKPRLGLQLTLNIFRIFTGKMRTAKQDYRAMLTNNLAQKS